VQIHIAELGDDEVEDIRLAHLLNFIFELEKIKDRADIGREAFDVADEMLFDVVRVAFELLKVEVRVIVEPLVGFLVQKLV